MKLSSKSILSSGRTDKQISLSASLSRRLRSNSSIKGGQSPMFPTGVKKRGSGFENTEPTSPKVTCIGQVRVKTKKKQAMKMKSMSQRRGSSGGASFRRIEHKLDQNHHQHSGYLQQHQQTQSQNLQQQEGLQQRNQKWVHLPLTICETLRAFGAEFNCFLPCRSSCMSSSSTGERDKDQKMNGTSIGDGETSTRSCGAVFARWLVTLQEGDVKGRKIELVVGGAEEETERSYRRRHVMEDIDINEVEKCIVDKIEAVEEAGRVSICVPPKNALLLMRCRSDPLRMASLTNRLWESSATKDDEDYDNDDEQFHHGKEHEEDKETLEKEESLEVVLETEPEEDENFEGLVSHGADEDYGVSEDTSILVMEVNDQEDLQESLQKISHPQQESTVSEEEDDEEEGMEVNEITETELVCNSSPEAQIDPEYHEIKENKAGLIQEDDDEFEGDEARRASPQSSVSPLSVNSEKEENHEREAEAETTMVRALEEETAETLSEDEETVAHQRSEPEASESSVKEEAELERESYQPTNLVRESRSTTLPDCLLLMMCEPKLSMEVSKETWVCSTDFIRCVPTQQRKVNKTNGRDEPKKKVTIDSNPGPPTQNLLLQPPRSSCSFPVAAAAHGVSMAAMIEQKLGNSVAYEPFVLTRCKSAPIKTSAKFAQQEGCFWKNRKLEQHRGAALGVGAAGIGF